MQLPWLVSILEGQTDYVNSFFMHFFTLYEDKIVSIYD